MMICMREAQDWRERSRRKGMDVTLNRLITFVSTGDLAQLVQEIAIDGNSFWDDIVDAIGKISSVRDAVMHNQIIDERSLEELYVLQAKIYSALNNIVVFSSYYE